MVEHVVVRCFSSFSEGLLQLPLNSIRISKEDWNHLNTSKSHCSAMKLYHSEKTLKSDQFIVCRALVDTSIQPGQIELSSWCMRYMNMKDASYGCLQQIESCTSKIETVELVLLETLSFSNPLFGRKKQFNMNNKMDWNVHIARKLSNQYLSIGSACAVRLMGEEMIFQVVNLISNEGNTLNHGIVQLNSKIQQIHKKNSTSNRPQPPLQEEDIVDKQEEEEEKQEEEEEKQEEEEEKQEEEEEKQEEEEEKQEVEGLGLNSIMKTIMKSWLSRCDSAIFVELNRLVVLSSRRENTIVSDVVSPVGILIHGVSGVGKTALLDALAMSWKDHSNVIIFHYFGPDILLKDLTLDEIFDEKNSNGFTLVLIDHADCLFQNDQVFGLLKAMDRVYEERLKVCFVCSVRNLQLIPLSCQRQGRFDQVVVVPVPSEVERRKIIENQLNLKKSRGQKSRGQKSRDHHPFDKHNTSMIQPSQASASPTSMIQPPQASASLTSMIQRLASQTGGYVGKDLVRVCTLAQLFAKQRQDQHKESLSVTSSVTSCGQVMGLDFDFELIWDDLQLALNCTHPSQLRDLDVRTTVGDYSWNSFGGYPYLKSQLQSWIESRFSTCSIGLNRLGITSSKGILLYGPSGCGKTFLAKVIAAESKCNFVWVKSNEIMSKYLGESEKAIKNLFAQARSAHPCVLFFDEIDAIADKRQFGGKNEGNNAGSVYSRILSTLLNEMDGIESLNSDVVVLAATNRKDALDAALIRPGRIDKCLEVGLPTMEDRKLIFQVYGEKMPLLNDVDFSILSTEEYTSQCTGSDIQSICRSAALRALREDMDCIHVARKHFLQVLQDRNSKRKTKYFFS